MRSQDERAEARTASTHMCAKCGMPMRLISARPLALSRAVEEHLYKCTTCRAEAAEIVTFERRPRRSA